VALALLAAGLTACSSSDKPGQQLTATQQLAAAKAKADAATSMHLTLRSSGIPDSANGALGADGSGTHAPAFKGTLDARIGGFQAKVEVVAIGQLLYLKLPFTTEFAQVDPKEYGAPNPAQLFAPVGGITSLMTETTNLVEGKVTRQGADVLKTITGKLPGASVAKLLSRRRRQDLRRHLRDHRPRRRAAQRDHGRPVLPGRNLYVHPHAGQVRRSG